MAVNSLSNKSSVAHPKDPQEAVNGVKAKLEGLRSELKAVNGQIRDLQKKLSSKAALTNTADAIQTPDALKSEAKRLKGEIAHWESVLNPSTAETHTPDSGTQEPNYKLPPPSLKRKEPETKLAAPPPAKRQNSGSDKAQGETKFSNSFASALKEFKLSPDGQLVPELPKDTETF